MNDESISPLAILMRGVVHWNKWRQRNPEVIPSLDGADLRGADLRNAMLFDTNIRWADLTGANLQGAVLYQAEMYQSCLRRCELSDADLRGAKLHDADLSEAVLRGANLYRCDFINTQLDGTSFANAYCGTTAFSNVDLSGVTGLDSVRHMGPSNVDLLTISRSRRSLPIRFLSAAGTPDSVLAAIRHLAATVDPALYHSCFISYSHKDEAFATTLCERLRAAGVSAWYAPENVTPGLKLHDQIYRAIRTHDRLLVVLSAHSMRSEWVLTELRGARKREQCENRPILFPIALAPMDTIRQWECFDADTGKDIAVELREYFIPDFSRWQESVEFDRQFGKLLKGLRIGANDTEEKP